MMSLALKVKVKLFLFKLQTGSSIEGTLSRLGQLLCCSFCRCCSAQGREAEDTRLCYFEAWLLRAEASMLCRPEGPKLRALLPDLGSRYWGRLPRQDPAVRYASTLGTLSTVVSAFGTSWRSKDIQRLQQGFIPRSSLDVIHNREQILPVQRNAVFLYFDHKN